FEINSIIGLNIVTRRDHIRCKWTKRLYHGNSQTHIPGTPMQRDPVDRLVNAALISDDEFVHALREVMQRDLRISVRELAEKSGVAPSSLYKMLHGKRSPNLTTLRAIVQAMRRITLSSEGEFIGLIAARPVLDVILERNAEVDGRKV